MDNKLNSILREIHDKEEGFRDYKRKKSVVSLGGVKEILTVTSGFNIKNKYKFDKVVGFLIFARLIDLFDFSKSHDADDVTICIHNSKHPNKEKILAVWNNIKNDYPYLDKLLPLLASYQLQDYQNAEDDIASWVNLQYLTGDYDKKMTGVALSIIQKTQKKLNVDIDHGNVLLAIDDFFGISIIDDYFAPKDTKVTVFSKKIMDAVKINCYMLNRFANYSLIEREDDKVFPFKEAKFNVVIYQRFKDEPAHNLSEILNYVLEGGTCVAFCQNTNKVDDAFYKCQVPIVIDIINGVKDNIVFVCKKTPDKSQYIYYGHLFNDGYGMQKKDLISCIESDISKWNVYQKLTKEDFKLNGNDISFQRVQHPRGQEEFIWQDLSEIITSGPEGEWVYNTNFDEEKMFGGGVLSKDPFKINAPANYYLDHFVNEPNGNHPLKDCPIKKKNEYEYDWDIAEKYGDIFEKTFGIETIKNSETDKFSKMLCGRLLYEPALLYARECGILRVNATKTHPFCYNPYYFHQEPYDEGGYFNCDPQMESIRINKDYDENFIIYQLLKDGVRGDHILVAPTKEEQHTYILSKRRDHIAGLLSTIDEMEDDVRQRIADVSSRIVGVGFKNFRRFNNLGTLPLGGVNILVGANNAGKSTFVKGLLLAIDNLKTMRVEYSDNIFDSAEQPIFRLDSNNYPDVHIGNFNRAYSWSPISDVKGVEFNLSIANYEISFVVSKDNDNETSTVPISRILIRDTKRKATFDIDYKSRDVHVNIYAAGNQIDYSTQVAISSDRIGSLLIPQLIRGIAIDAENKKEKDYADAKRLHVWSGFIYEIAEELEGIINNTTVEYIYAHGISQRALFDYNDRNDYMAMTLHDLINEKIGKEERNFVNKWLEKFGIGVSYEVSSVVGESYILRIKDKNGNMAYLADMGMGANQLVTLLFRLAIFIHKQRMRGNSPYKPTIVIEEPEQNMHPAFQSLLADLFFEVEQKYGFSFIVETHSEYLVRRAQVIVASQNYKDEKELEEKNPFKVYYFPSNKNPYDMKFRTDGNFREEFGPGFYDEATNLLFQII